MSPLILAVALLAQTGGGGTMTAGGQGGGQAAGGGSGGGGFVINNDAGPATGGGGGGGITGSTGGGAAGGFGGGNFAGGVGGGGMTTGTGGGAGGGIVSSDGGVMRDPLDLWADLAWSGGTNPAIAVWVDGRRDSSFGTPRRRAVDLWTNSWLSSGALRAPFGELLCQTLVGETFSEPRVATSVGGATVIVWRVATAGIRGHAIRVATLSPTGVLSSCGDTLVPSDGSTPLTHLHLSTSAEEFFLVWETPSRVMARYISSPAPPPLTLAVKPVVGAAASPTVTPADSGFFVAWTQNDQFWGVRVDSLRLGAAVRSPQIYFQNLTPLSRATAVSPPLAGVFIAPFGGQPHLWAGPVDNTASVLLTGPFAGPHPLVAASVRAGSPTRTFVAHETEAANAFALTEFSIGAFTTALPRGLEPLAMITDDRRAQLLMGSNAPLSVHQVVPATLGSPPSMAAGVETRALAHQLRPSAVWSEVGRGWVIAWHEKLNLFGGLVSPGSGLLTSKGSTPQVAGNTFTLHQASAGPRVALNVFGNGVTNVYLTGADSTDLVSLLLSSPGEQSAAVVGDEVTAAWIPGADSLSVGSGSVQPQNFAGARFGRSGIWAEGALWIPLLFGTELAVLEVPDSADNPNAVLHNLGAFGLVAPPALAVRGDQLLVLAHSATDELVVASTTFNDVIANHPVRPIALVPRPAGRAVFQPVAAPTPRGWQLAWESPDESGTVILGLKLDLAGVSSDVDMLSFGNEARNPLLVAAPDGSVLLLWQYFADRTGNVMVKTKLLGPDLPIDGGVSDGGLFDGGLSDGGLSVDQPIVYRTCGCQSGGAALLMLGLLLLARRRAATRR